METSTIGWYLIPFYVWLPVVEFFLRRAEHGRRKIPYLAHVRYLALNMVLWILSIILGSWGLVKGYEQFLLASFQVIWMHAAGLQIYMLRKVLFENTFKPPRYCAPYLVLAALVQLAGAILCMWIAAPGSNPPIMKKIMVGLLQGGWFLYDFVLFMWTMWTCSSRGVKGLQDFVHWVFKVGKYRRWTLVSPLIGALIGAIPTSWWWDAQITFLIACALRGIFYTIPVMLPSSTDDPSLQPEFYCFSSHCTLLSMFNRKEDPGLTTTASICMSPGEDSSTMGSESIVTNAIV